MGVPVGGGTFTGANGLGWRNIEPARGGGGAGSELRVSQSKRAEGREQKIYRITGQSALL